MPAAELRTGPGRLNLPQFFPGNQVTLELTWPAGVLDGRSFTAHLGDEALALSVDGDVMTIIASSAVTVAVTETTDWVLDEVGGNALIVGVWVPDTSGVVAPRYETVVITDTPQVTVQVASVGAPGGVVDAITAGDHLSVDASDPANPVVSVDGADFDAAGSAAVVASDLAGEVSARVAGDTALDGRLDAIEVLGPLATSAALDAAVLGLSVDVAEGLGEVQAEVDALDADKASTADVAAGYVASANFRTITQVTQAEYDGLTPDPNTLYVIIG